MPNVKQEVQVLENYINGQWVKSNSCCESFSLQASLSTTYVRLTSSGFSKNGISAWV